MQELSTSQTPRKRGFTMPAEWEPHSATWLIWPHRQEHWPGKFEITAPMWARMVKELETGEDVHIIFHDQKTEDRAQAAMNKAGVSGARIDTHRFANNYSWARDEGPIFVKRKKDCHPEEPLSAFETASDALRPPQADNGASRRVTADAEIIMTHWQFNGWGEQWEHNLDDHVPEEIARITEIPRVQVPMVLEGGSIDVNGQGTLLTTSSCLLNPNRNPTLTKEQIEKNLKDYLGVTNVLWLGEGIEGDDTSGHVDDLTRFIGPSAVVTVVEPDKNDSNHKPLAENLALLKSMRDQDGNPLTVLELPLPKPVIYENTRLPATYANFYIGNDVVLLPVFDDQNDKIAIDTLQHAFPNRRIAPINARDLVWGLGAFHCVTQQQPA